MVFTFYSQSIGFMIGKSIFLLKSWTTNKDFQRRAGVSFVIPISDIK
jgi:hypothetical protein